MLRFTARAEQVLTTEIDDWIRTEAGLWIDALTLTNVVAAQAHVFHLAHSSLADHLNRLDLSDNLLRDNLCPLTWGHRLPFLTELVLVHNRLRANHIRSLAQRPFSRRLTLLDLRHNRLDDAAARILTESPHLQNLTALRVRHNHFTVDGIVLLRQAFGERVRF
jgi:hypothetical protein